MKYSSFTIWFIIIFMVLFTFIIATFIQGRHYSKQFDAMHNFGSCVILVDTDYSAGCACMKDALVELNESGWDEATVADNALFYERRC